MMKSSSPVCLAGAMTARSPGVNGKETMYILIMIIWSALALPIVVHADVGKVVEPLSCGIYDQMVKPFIEAELETQHADQSRYTMAITTKSGKRLSVEVKSVSIKL